jgi:hypothetical protein
MTKKIYLSLDDSVLSDVSNTIERSDSTLNSFGNIPKGLNLKGMTFKDFIDIQYYSILPIHFTNFQIAGVQSKQEVGTTIPANLSFIYSVSDSEKVDQIIELKDITNDIVLATNIISSPINTNSNELTNISPGTQIYRIEGRDKENRIFSKDINIDFLWKIYYGESNNEVLDNTEINSLRQQILSNTFEGNFNFSGGGYKFFCYPAEWGEVSTFRDNETSIAIAMDDPKTIEVTNQQGISKQYVVYRTFNKFVTELNINVF